MKNGANFVREDRPAYLPSWRFRLARWWLEYQEGVILALAMIAIAIVVFKVAVYFL